MRTPSPRRRRFIIVAAAIILFVTIVGWVVFCSPPSESLTISYAGVEPGHSNTVGFWVTNTTRQRVSLEILRVQAVGEGKEKTEPETQLPVFGDTKSPLTYFSPMNLAPGEYKKILIPPPTNTVWRAELMYTSELKGLSALATRMRIALVERDPRVLRVRGNPWTVHTNFTDPITNTPPKS